MTDLPDTAADTDTVTDLPDTAAGTNTGLPNTEADIDTVTGRGVGGGGVMLEDWPQADWSKTKYQNFRNNSCGNMLQSKKSLTLKK